MPYLCRKPPIIQKAAVHFLALNSDLVQLCNSIMLVLKRLIIKTETTNHKVRALNSDLVFYVTA